jgi:hypothetical protein
MRSTPLAGERAGRSTGTQIATLTKGAESCQRHRRAARRGDAPGEDGRCRNGGPFRPVADPLQSAAMAARPIAADAPLEPVRLAFRLLAWAFGVTGTLFLLFPAGTVRTMNGAGGLLGLPPAPPSDLRFWLSLGVAYMVLVTILAATIARDPWRFLHLMPILAAGKLTSSLTCLWFFVAVQPAFIYLANFVVDGSITLVVLAGYVWTWALPAPAGRAAAGGATGAAAAEAGGGPGADDLALLRALLHAMIPAGGAFALGAKDTPLDHDLWRYFASLHPLGPAGLRLLLRVVEYGPLLDGRLRRFSTLPPEEQERTLARWESSRLGPRRQLFASLKLLVTMHFYDYPAAKAATGFSEEYLTAKLLAGPNAEHHRIRLARAAAEGARQAAGPAGGAP